MRPQQPLRTRVPTGTVSPGTLEPLYRKTGVKVQYKNACTRFSPIGRDYFMNENRNGYGKKKNVQRANAGTTLTVSTLDGDGFAVQKLGEPDGVLGAHPEHVLGVFVQLLDAVRGHVVTDVRHPGPDHFAHVAPLHLVRRYVQSSVVRRFVPLDRHRVRADVFDAHRPLRRARLVCTIHGYYSSLRDAF